MKSILKNVYVIVCTLVLVILCFFAEGVGAETEEVVTDPFFRVRNNSGWQDVSIYDAEDGCYYVFLPSYTDLSQVTPVLPPDREFYLDDIRLSEEITCDLFELEKPYQLSVDGEPAATLLFYKSQNVATMFLDTVSGGMTDIHNDKAHEEYTSMTLYLPDGSVDYFDGSSKLKGRGNSTWGCDKRPYLLSLSVDGGLLGMDSARKWVLLANAYDETNLNNKLIYDLASQIPFRWSPDSRFVDLYLNGEYSGLYLLTEKIEVHRNRLNIDAAAGEFLCKLDTWDRRESLPCYFESSMGRIIEVCFPEVLPASDFDYITYLVYMMEKDFSGDGNLVYSEMVDLDSWVRRYLIDEISGNIDSDLTSSYFYYSDGKFYAGPIWDYDIALGNSVRNQEPHAFIAKNWMKRTNRPSPYYSGLYSNESFYQRMVEIYESEFSPILQKMIREDIDAQMDLIHAASRMNSIRWRDMYDEWIEITADTGIVRTAADLKAYFTRRIQFLDSAWLEDKDYCTVQFEPGPGHPYWNISVEKGSYLITDYMDLNNTVWLDKETGEPVDFQKPITQDRIVTVDIPADPSAAG